MIPGHAQPELGGGLRYLDILGVNLDCNHWHDSGLRDYAIALVSEYLSRGWHVIATVRSTSRQSDLRDLQRHAGDALEIEQVDMTDAEQIALMSSRLASVTNNVAGGWASTARASGGEHIDALLRGPP